MQLTHKGVDSLQVSVRQAYPGLSHLPSEYIHYPPCTTIWHLQTLSLSPLLLFPSARSPSLLPSALLPISTHNYFPVQIPPLFDQLCSVWNAQLSFFPPINVSWVSQCGVGDPVYIFLFTLARAPSLQPSSCCTSLCTYSSTIFIKTLSTWSTENASSSSMNFQDLP